MLVQVSPLCFCASGSVGLNWAHVCAGFTATDVLYLGTIGHVIVSACACCLCSCEAAGMTYSCWFFFLLPHPVSWICL